MIEEQALVIALRSDQALIEVQRQNACQSCDLSEGCGTGSLGRLLGYKKLALSIPNRHKLQVGDRIVIGMPDKYFHFAGFLVYLLPLLSLFLFGLVANYFFNGAESVIVLASLSGLVFGLMFSGRMAKNDFALKMKPQFIRQEFSPQVVEPRLKTSFKI
ncbi:MAG: SoxR reducing system RseC family protein [Gammaproteobacteria bacterium]|jgi:sigma-E factor negative regulatory protein RseC|nr:SoxR reducing system RseC family protein [Gammaproteobacteria bacterium]MBT3724040.1 SoxR reducing system RseC family protein [Gammaproteobacteria bacterium]MBT4076640.1 SoxR reducing system RseC family protein [Gammaproteobacteria bacterium]MBT4196820.1 SoxR reducing system RseC family protein [Gammaproteobacteria bacterium]MBT4451205.1 SoxR reducing system RseC family protein [Gammaproteobacteria bacterium]